MNTIILFTTYKITYFDIIREVGLKYMLNICRVHREENPETNVLGFECREMHCIVCKQIKHTVEISCELQGQTQKGP